MPAWKLSIFVSAVKIQYAAREGSLEEILATYPKLTESEKAEIMTVLTY